MHRHQQRRQIRQQNLQLWPSRTTIKPVVDRKTRHQNIVSTTWAPIIHIHRKRHPRQRHRLTRTRQYRRTSSHDARHRNRRRPQTTICLDFHWISTTVSHDTTSTTGNSLDPTTPMDHRHTHQKTLPYFARHHTESPVCPRSRPTRTPST